MTSTNPLNIGDTLAYRTGRYAIRMQRPTAAAWTVVVEQGRLRVAELSRTFGTESDARDLAREVSKRLRDGATVDEVIAAVRPTIPAPRLAPAAKGTTLKVTDPQHTTLAIAATLGWVERGSLDDGKAPITTINALARRGYLDRTYRYEGRRRIVTGATITSPGRLRLAELDATATRTPLPIAA